MSEAANQPACPPLAADHQGMRVDYIGLLSQCQHALRREPAQAEMLRQLQEHLRELGTRFYAGDPAVVDEFLQLYSITRHARADVVAARTAASPLTAGCTASPSGKHEGESKTMHHWCVWCSEEIGARGAGDAA
jgi:hypothetical protein